MSTEAENDRPRLAFLWRGVGGSGSCATLNGMDIGHMLTGATMEFNVGDPPKLVLHFAANVEVGVATELVEGLGIQITQPPKPSSRWGRLKRIWR